MVTSTHIRRLGALACLATFPLLGWAGCSAPDGAATSSSSQAVGSGGLVISAVYGAGGNVGALFNSDFVELYNRSGASISLQGMSLQYGSATGDFAVVATLPNVTIAPGRYFLVAAGTPETGTPLPAADFISGALALGATNGKVALASVTTPLGCGGSIDAGAGVDGGPNRCASANVVDMVGYGTANDYEGPTGSGIPALGATLAGERKGFGCIDTDVNKADFDVVTVVAPRNQSTAALPCGAGIDGGLDAAGDGNASTDGATDDGATPDASDDGAAPDASDDGATPDASDDGASPDASDDGATDDGAANDGGADSGPTDGGADSGPTDGGTDSSPTEAGPPGDGTGLVISAVYGGGGNSGAIVNHDYVELFNRTNKAVATTGLSIQYGSAARDFGSPTADGGPSVDILPLPDTLVPANAYFLVSLSSTNPDSGAPIPTPDVTGNLALASTNGKVALAKITTGLGCGGTSDGGARRCTTANIVDMVGYGTSSDYEGSGAVPVLSNTTAAARKGAGCIDTNDNKADFDVGAPAPRNTASPRVKCTQTPPPGGGDDVGFEAGPGPGSSSGSSGTSGSSGSSGGGDSGANPLGDTGGSTDTGGCNCNTNGGGRGESPLAFGIALLGVALVRRRRAA